MTSERSKAIAKAVQAKLEGSPVPRVLNEWRYFRASDSAVVWYTVAPLVQEFSAERQPIPEKDYGKYGVIVVAIINALMVGTRARRIYYRAFKRRKDAKAKALELVERYQSRKRRISKRVKAR